MQAVSFRGVLCFFRGLIFWQRSKWLIITSWSLKNARWISWAGCGIFKGGVALFHLAKRDNLTKVLLRGLNGAENDRNCSAYMLMFQEDISQYSMIFISRLMMYGLEQIQRLFLGKDMACMFFFVIDFWFPSTIRFDSVLENLFGTFCQAWNHNKSKRCSITLLRW